MKTLTSRELEIQQVKLAIAAADTEIARLTTAVAVMREKQIARHREVARQEAYLHCSNDQAHA